MMLFYHCNIKHTRYLNVLFLTTNTTVNIMYFLNTFKHATLYFYDTKCLVA